ncbi:hypothetical protein PR048_016983 [Dryococelus australis]|uniref:Uncharacterized protein n=1 Tax=Dryococelus australis TaxID=614101 RepID=A0ABQ9H896_9NEOP|nr:hypothetical protein PR048_016983 [Dryococelus australis]
MKKRGKRGTFRDQQHRRTRSPHARILERPRRESNPVRRGGGRRVAYPLHHRRVNYVPCGPAMRSSDVRWSRGKVSLGAASTPRSGAGMKGRGKWEIPEKTRRPSSGTSPTCENPVTRPGIEPGSPWWEASVLTAQPLWHHYFSNDYLRQSLASTITTRHRLNEAGLQAPMRRRPLCRLPSLLGIISRDPRISWVRF